MSLLLSVPGNKVVSVFISFQRSHLSLSAPSTAIRNWVKLSFWPVTLSMAARLLLISGPARETLRLRRLQMENVSSLCACEILGSVHNHVFKHAFDCVCSCEHWDTVN